jgi:hypothetical protein
MASASWILPLSKFNYPTGVSVANNGLTQLTQSVFEQILGYFVTNNFTADGKAVLEIEQSKFE